MPLVLVALFFLENCWAMRIAPRLKFSDRESSLFEPCPGLVAEKLLLADCGRGTAVSTDVRAP